MKRRAFLGNVIASAAATKVPGLFSSNLSADPPLPTPRWLDTEPLIVAWNTSDIEIFRRRAGRNTLWRAASFEREQSEEGVSLIKDLGVTLVIISLYMGFGLEAEKEHIEDTRKLAALLKRYGIRVAVYVGSTIMYETFLLEKPEAKEWFVQDYFAKPVIYDHQPFRKRVYFMHPGYREYIKGVLRLAVEELKVDLIHFDNTSMQAEPAIFQHPMAVEDFRNFLRSRYSAQELKERLGFSDVRYVEAPRPDWPLSTIDDPMWQEWTEFRCQQLARYYGEMKQYIRGLNPNVAVATNPHSGLSGINTIWNQGVDYPVLLPQMDVTWSEEGDYGGMDADGILISKIRTYKMAASLNSRVLTYTTRMVPGDGGALSEVPGGRVEMAESMAYNRQSLGSVAVGLAGYRLPQEERGFLQFFREHFDLYRATESVADIALLYSHATMGFNNDRPAVSFILFGQTLIQAKVPFHQIFDEHLKNLAKYRVLVLADQECLDDEQLNLIRNYVLEGGALVATEHTSLYSETRRRRQDFGLQDLFHIPKPAWLGQGVPEPVMDIETVRHEAGKGRVAYIPEVRPAIEKPPTEPMTHKYWKLPQNWQSLVDTVRWAAGGQLTLEVDAPLCVTAELVRQPETGKLLLHLINYDAERTPIVQNIEVRLREGKEASSVTVISPDEDGRQMLAPEFKNGALTFTVPKLKVYDVVVIS